MLTWRFTLKSQILDRPESDVNNAEAYNYFCKNMVFDAIVLVFIVYGLLYAFKLQWVSGNYVIAAFFAPALISLIYVLLRVVRGEYGLQDCPHLRYELPTIFLCWSSGLVFVVVAFHALGHGADISRGWLAASYVTGLVLLPLGRAGVAITSAGGPGKDRAFYRNAYMISVDRDAEASAIIRDAMDDGARVVGISYLDSGDRQTSSVGFLDGMAEEIRKVLFQTDIDEIYIRCPNDRRQILDEIITLLSGFPVRVLLIDEPAGDIPGRRVVRLGNRMATELLSPPISARGRVAKRILDITVASVALLSLLPILAMACVGIAIESGRPIIFRQNRKGVYGRPFTILKFRTMSVQENGDKVVQACRNDPRVTRLGAIFRRTSIDELPQLLNVIRGDMSIVGPRPHALAHDSYYGALIKDYSRRHNVKPGLTGWAQVNGFRGETRDLHAMSERVRHDIWYIENWTIWLDIRIIARTAGCVLFQKQAY